LDGAAPRIFRPMDPDFLHGAPPTDACAAFIKESRMKFANARELDRKSGCTLERTWGTRPGKRGLVVCSRAALLTCSSQAFLANLVPQPRAAVSDHSINSRLKLHASANLDSMIFIRPLGTWFRNPAITALLSQVFSAYSQTLTSSKWLRGCKSYESSGQVLR